MSLLIPTFFINKITDLSPEFIKSHSVTTLLMDIDDTLTYHKDPQIPQKVLEFINLMKANNIKIILISNNSKKRVSKFAKKLNLPYIFRAFKPLPFGINCALKKLNISKRNAIIIGDQIFTDILGANLLGIKSVLVNPFEKNQTIFLKLKRLFEIPVRKKLKIIDLKKYNFKGELKWVL